MEISISMPLDSDGFLRRECPNCDRQFKWLPGGTGEHPDGYVDPPVYHCPYCGRSAPPNGWWTQEQLDHAEAMMAEPAHNEVRNRLGDAFNGLRGGPLGMDVKISSEEPDPPEPLTELDDMIGVLPPCHPWEPVKLDEDWKDSAHCIVCGEPFDY